MAAKVQVFARRDTKECERAVIFSAPACSWILMSGGWCLIGLNLADWRGAAYRFGDWAGRTGNLECRFCDRLGQCLGR